LTDAQLLYEARRGDAEAWRTLYTRYLPTVWRAACALVDNAHVAEDLTSETMLAFVENIDRLDAGVPKIAGWLRTVVRRKAADHFRKDFRNKIKIATASTAAKAGSALHPGGNLETLETRKRVLEVLDRMSERQRIVLEWKYFDALSVREIAEWLGETEKAIEAALYRARREFRRLFESTRICTIDANSSPNPSSDISQQV
jgi:RNA polymerase sigma-70 factor, ECF subfamily